MSIYDEWSRRSPCDSTLLQPSQYPTALYINMDGYETYAEPRPTLARAPSTREREEYRPADPYRDRRRSPGKTGDIQLNGRTNGQQNRGDVVVIANAGAPVRRHRSTDISPIASRAMITTAVMTIVSVVALLHSPQPSTDTCLGRTMCLHSSSSTHCRTR